MTTFNMNSAPLAVLTVLSVLGSATTMAQQPQGVAESASAKTSLAGLDLSTPEGMAAAKERVHQAARKVCSRIQHSTDLDHQANFIECVDATMASALLQLSNPKPLQAKATPAVVTKPIAAVTFPDAISKSVSFADLDLSTPQGARAAHERLRRVAGTLCMRVEDHLDLSWQANFSACVDTAMMQALPKVEELARIKAPTPAVAQTPSR
jgi:UrcA family protein